MCNWFSNKKNVSSGQSECSPTWPLRGATHFLFPFKMTPDLLTRGKLLWTSHFSRFVSFRGSFGSSFSLGFRHEFKAASQIHRNAVVAVSVSVSATVLAVSSRTHERYCRDRILLNTKSSAVGCMMSAHCWNQLHCWNYWMLFRSLFFSRSVKPDNNHDTFREHIFMLCL